MATNGFVQVAPDSTGKRIDNDELVVSGSVVYRQRIRLSGTSDTALAEVLSTVPASNEFGVVVRPIPSSASQPVSAGQTTSAGTPAGFTVSTSATILAAANSNRKAIVITNNGAGKLYLGHTNGVTASGAAMGLQVPAGGSYSDSGFGLYIGDLYGIYDAVAASQNVSVSERV